MFLKIKPGQQVGQNGKVYVADDVIDVPNAIVAEFMGMGDPCDKDGTLIEGPVDVDYAAYRLHEQVTLWEQELEKRQAAVAEAEAKLATAKQAQADEEAAKAAPVDDAASDADTKHDQ
jgi:hypothetical protein